MPVGGQRLAFRPATSTLRCAASSAATGSTRQFTTSSCRQRVSIPPESPKFINLPEPPQSRELPKFRIRGKLPVPRQIFDLRQRTPGTPNHGRKDPRLQRGYLDRVMPRPNAKLDGEDSTMSPLQEWRRKMTENRRQALAQGIRGLYKRQVTKDQSEKQQRSRIRRADARAFNSPERPDEVLTRSTIRADTFNTKVVLDPLRHERAAESAKITAAVLEARVERRRDALQGLYMAAKDFIVTEDELAKRIETVFSEDHFGNKFADGNTGLPPASIWETRGKPLRVNELMSQFTRNSSNQGGASTEAKETQRQKNVSEELTGGKL